MTVPSLTSNSSLEKAAALQAARHVAEAVETAHVRVVRLVRVDYLVASGFVPNI